MFLNSMIKVLKRNRHTTVFTTGQKKGKEYNYGIKYKCFAFYFGFFSIEMRNRGASKQKFLHKVA